MKTNDKLSPRQWKLYNFLCDNYVSGVYISKQQICDALPNDYKVVKNETRVCRAIENDVRQINFSSVIQKVIVSNKSGYKIGNREESEKYISKRFARDLKNLKLDWKLSKKICLDGQMKITFGKEREFIESFINDNNDSNNNNSGEGGA